MARTTKATKARQGETLAQKKRRLTRLFNLLLAGAVLVLCSGADCEARRLDGLDEGHMVHPDGSVITYCDLPFAVTPDDSFDDPTVITEAIDAVNARFGLDALIGGAVDVYRWQDLATNGHRYRSGTILLWVGALPVDEWEWGEMEPVTAGGTARLFFRPGGCIDHADIVIDYADAYHRDTVRRRLLHEFGHAVFGLDHDGDSIDLGSCMSSPAPYGCDFTDGDVELIRSEADL